MKSVTDEAFIIPRKEGGDNMSKEEIALQLALKAIDLNAVVPSSSTTSSERYNFLVNSLTQLYKDIYNELNK